MISCGRDAGLMNFNAKTGMVFVPKNEDGTDELPEAPR